MKVRELRLERRRDQVRDEILSATRSVLLERGLAGLTLAAVAQKVQLTKAALYYYFPSKEALAFELIYQCLESQTKAIETAVEPTRSGTEAIEALIRATAAYFAERKDELRLTYLVP